MSPRSGRGAERYRHRDPRKTAPYRLLTEHLDSLMAVHGDRYEDGVVHLTFPRPDHRRGDKELTFSP